MNTSTQSQSYYHRVEKPRIDAGICRLTNCGKRLHGRGMCLEHFNKYFPGSKTMQERRDDNPWLKVDWKKKDATLAEQLGVTLKTVAQARCRYGPRCECCNGPLSRSRLIEMSKPKMK